MKLLQSTILVVSPAMAVEAPKQSPTAQVVTKSTHAVPTGTPIDVIVFALVLLGIITIPGLGGPSSLGK